MYTHITEIQFVSYFAAADLFPLWRTNIIYSPFFQFHCKSCVYICYCCCHCCLFWIAVLNIFLLFVLLSVFVPSFFVLFTTHRLTSFNIFVLRLYWHVLRIVRFGMWWIVYVVYSRLYSLAYLLTHSLSHMLIHNCVSVRLSNLYNKYILYLYNINISMRANYKFGIRHIYTIHMRI